MKLFRRAAFRALLASAGMLPLGARSVLAKGYPTGPITLVMPFAVGATDVVARMSGAAMMNSPGQRAVIKNKKGQAARSPPPPPSGARLTGHTFPIHHNGMGAAPALC